MKNNQKHIKYLVCGQCNKLNTLKLAMKTLIRLEDKEDYYSFVYRCNCGCVNYHHIRKVEGTNFDLSRIEKYFNQH